MKINQEQINQLAKLARIKIDPAEAGKFQADLGDILDYVDQLKQVEVSHSEEFFCVNDNKNNWRKDVSQKSKQDDRELIIKNFSDEEDDYLKVKRIL